MSRSRALSLALLAAVAVAALTWLATRPTAPDADESKDAVPAARVPPGLAAPGLSARPESGMDAKEPAGKPPETATEKADGAEPASATGPSLRVLVTAGEAEPLAGVTLWVVPHESRAHAVRAGRTGADGAARLAGVPELATVRAFAEGYVPAQTPYSTSTGHVELRLERGTPVDGRVEDAATGSPIAGANIRLLGSGIELAPSDEQGRFHVPGIGDSEVVEAEAPGYSAERVYVRVEDGKPMPPVPVLRLAPSGTVVGVVRTAEGVPVAGARVRFRSRLAPWGSEWEVHDELATLERRRDDGFLSVADARDRPGDMGTVTKADGSFRESGLRADAEYLVTAIAEGRARSAAAGPLRATAGTVTSVALVLRKHGSALVRVLSAPDTSLPRELRVRVAQEGRLFQPSAREPDGRFRFEGLDPGPADAFVQAEGFPSAGLPITIPEDGTAEVDLRLDAGVEVAGIVVDAAGEPVHGALVSVAPAGLDGLASLLELEGSKMVASDGIGHFVVGGIVAGPVTVVAALGPRRVESRQWLATRNFVHVIAPARDVRVVIAPLGGIRVRLLEPGGKPLTGNVPYRLFHDEQTQASGQEPEDGVMAYSNVPDGRYGWLLEPKGYAWLMLTAVVRDGADVDLGDVVLDRGIEVTGRVVDREGRGVPEAEVAAGEPEPFEPLRDDAVSPRYTSTDGEGRFVLTRIPRRQLALRVYPDGFVAPTVALDPAKPTGIEIRLVRLAKVHGLVKSAAGAPAPSSSIELRPPGAKRIVDVGQGPDGQPKEYVRHEGSQYLRADASGRYSGTPAPGFYRALWEDAAGVERLLGEFTFVEGEDREIELVLPGK